MGKITTKEEAFAAVRMHGSELRYVPYELMTAELCLAVESSQRTYFRHKSSPNRFLFDITDEVEEKFKEEVLAKLRTFGSS